jgi:RNA polymerase sigma factor (sigma-70 family)
MTTHAEASDTELVDRVRAGDPTAAAELWTRHHAETLAVARYWGNRGADAEDLASEAFATMLAAIAVGGGPRTSPMGYLAISVRNASMTSWRRVQTGDRLMGYLALSEQADVRDDDPVFATVGLVPLREAFASLPPRWQVVLWRTAVEGDSARAIANDLGLSPNAVAALGYRARTGLRLAFARALLAPDRAAPACRPFVEAMAPLVAGSAAPRPLLQAHVLTCQSCDDRLQSALADLPSTKGPNALVPGPRQGMTGPALTIINGTGGTSEPEQVAPDHLNRRQRRLAN